MVKTDSKKRNNCQVKIGKQISIKPLIGELLIRFERIATCLTCKANYSHDYDIANAIYH